MNNIDQPLWLLMRDAYEQSSGSIFGINDRIELPGPEREEFAAMLRVVASRISPPEEESHDFTDGSVAELQWRERRRIHHECAFGKL
jgi:hypothetical protein